MTGCQQISQSDDEIEVSDWCWVPGSASTECEPTIVNNIIGKFGYWEGVFIDLPADATQSMTPTLGRLLPGPPTTTELRM